VNVFAQSHTISDFNNLTWTRYSTVDGLPSNTITDLKFDHQGVLWIATPSGIARRDANGVVQVFSTSDGLLSNNIGLLHVDHQNRLWVSGSNAFMIYDGNWQPFSHNAILLKPGHLFPDRNNNLCVIENDETRRGLYKISDTGLDLILREKNMISSALYDVQGSLWVLVGDSLKKYSSGGLTNTFLLNSNGVAGLPVKIVEDRQSKIWVHYGNSLYKSSDYSNLSFIGTTFNYYMDAAFDSRNNIYLSRYNKAGGGIKVLNGSSWLEFNSANGLTSASAQAVAISQNDIIWVGADDGLYVSGGILSASPDLSKTKLSRLISIDNSGVYRLIIDMKDVNAVLYIYSMNGLKIDDWEMNQDQTILDLRHLQSGLYLARLECGKQIEVFKFHHK
jgi:ligand-binding sensor domain-containing protein